MPHLAPAGLLASAVMCGVIMRNLDLISPPSRMSRTRNPERRGAGLAPMSGVDRVVGQKSAHGTFQSYSHLQPLHLPSPPAPQFLLPSTRFLPVVLI